MKKDVLEKIKVITEQARDVKSDIKKSKGRNSLEETIHSKHQADNLRSLLKSLR